MVTGCASRTEPVNPSKQERVVDSQTSGYTEKTIILSDGRTVMCLWKGWDGAMSCDWENAL